MPRRANSLRSSSGSRNEPGFARAAFSSGTRTLPSPFAAELEDEHAAARLDHPSHLRGGRLLVAEVMEGV